MKRFQFTLQKLMDFREQELDRQKNTLSVLQSELIKIQKDTEDLKAKVNTLSGELDNLCREGMSVYEMSMRKRYIVTLQQEIHSKEALAIRKKADIERQLGVVVEATKDVRTLEKLEEKQLEEYRAAEGKENEQFIEEFVSGQTIRAAAV